MQPGRAWMSGLGVPLLSLAWWVGWVAPVHPTHGVLVLSCPSAALRVCGVPGHLAPVQQCAHVHYCVASAGSWATWLLFTGAPAPCVVLRERCPWPLGPRHGCVRWVCYVACAVSWATSLLFTGAPARCVALRVRCPGPLCSCSSVCLLCVLFCLCGVLGHLAPVYRCARSVCCFVCAVSWASWLLFGGVLGRGVPSICCPRCMCVCGVLAHVAPVHRCARCVRCACAVGGCVPPPPPLIFFFLFCFVFPF